MNDLPAPPPDTREQPIDRIQPTWRKGLYYRETLELWPGVLHYQNPRLFGTTERKVQIDQITQVDYQAGIRWATLTIAASGQGTVSVSGLRKAEAARFRDKLEAMQR